MDMKGKKALILGGAGLVGTAVCRELLAHEPAMLVVASRQQARAETCAARLSAVCAGDKTKIVHTTDYKVMLRESYKTETHAAKSYKSFLELPGIDSELYDAIEQIYFQEERSVEELNQLLDS